MPTMRQAACAAQKKAKLLLFGAESLIGKTDVQPTTAESDKYLQGAVELPAVVSGLLSQTSLNFTIEIMLFTDGTKYP